MRVWRGELDVPWWNGGDGLYELMRVKGVLDHGSLLSNPDLGAPFGQHLQDFPDSKPLQYVLIWMLGRGTSDPAVVGNVFFLLGFGLVAATAFVVLRWFGLSRAVCCACALLFSLSPYHFQHNEATLSLSAYYGVPLGAYLILAVLSGRRLFATVDGRHGAVRRWGSRISILTAAACVVIGLLDTYYAVFTIIVVIAATAVGFRDRLTAGSGRGIRGRRAGLRRVARRPEPEPGRPGRARPQPGRRRARPTRERGVQLHADLADAPDRRTSDRSPGAVRAPGEQPDHGGHEPASIGLIASLGLAWLLLVALSLSLTGARRRLDPRHGALAAAAVFVLLLGTTGGISGLIAWGVTPQIRTWSRLAVFVAFFALAAVGLLLDRARRHSDLHPSGRWST